MTLKWVPNIWLSESPDTDCKECGLRYFAHCARCKKIVCTWCSFVAEPLEGKEVIVCSECWPDWKPSSDVLERKVQELELQISAYEKRIPELCAEYLKKLEDAERLIDEAKGILRRVVENTRPNRITEDAEAFLQGKSLKRLCSGGQCKHEEGHEGDHVFNLMRR